MTLQERSDQLIAEVAFLKERVAALERVAFSAGSEYVEGWANAAKLLGITNITAINRHGRGEFPKPCRMLPIERADGNPHFKPVWRRADLVAYAEGK